MRATLALFVVLAGLSSCKKPHVEVEEEGPPLPIDPRAPPVQPGSPVGSPTEPGGEAAAPAPPLPLTIEQACAIVDAHMTSIGRDTYGRLCAGLVAEGAGLRLTGYSLARTPAPTQTWDGFPVCLWPRVAADAAATGPAWEFAYADGGKPCRTRQEYCTLGAEGVRFDVSSAACPGDDALLPESADVAERLQGNWVLASGAPGSLSIDAKGHVRLTASDLTLDGDLTVEAARRGNGVVLSSGDRTQGRAVGFALAKGLSGPILYFGFGDVATTANPDGFVASPLPGALVRIFGQKCYAIDPPPSDSANAIPCTFGKTASEAFVNIPVDTAVLTYSYVGSAWLSSAVYRWAWSRAPGGAPPTDPAPAVPALEP